MRRGFTILELLVATILLGMLATILTMVFNQSSISWRLGTSLVDDLSLARNKVAVVREEADNAFFWNNQVRRMVSPWDSQGNLRQRVCDCADVGGADSAASLATQFITLNTGAKLWDGSKNTLDVTAGKNGGSYDSYIVNVMSGGPRNDIMDWQAIWSYPDDFD